jgi:hypothetical protein
MGFCHAVRTTARRLLPALTLLAFAACADDAVPTPADGLYYVDLVAPEGHEDGAVLIQLQGGGIAEAVQVHGRMWSEMSPGGARVLLMTAWPGPLRFQVRLQDAPALPRAEILQVADIDNRLRGSLSGYSVTISR